MTVGTASRVDALCSITQKMNGSPLLRPRSVFSEARFTFREPAGLLDHERRAMAIGAVLQR